MVVSKKRIRFRIEAQSPTFEAVIRVLRGTQETVFAIGRYLEDTPLYGRLRSRVRIPCSLVLTKISMGSPIEGEASVAQLTTQAYFGEKGELEALEDLGDRCVSIFADVAENVCSGPIQGQKKMRKLITDTRHRLRIVRQFGQLIPDDMPLEIGTREKFYRFVPETKPLAIELADRIEKELVPTQGVETIIGPVTEARIVADRYFKIGQVDCSFSREFVPQIEASWGKVVSLTGKTVTVDGRKEFVEIDDFKLIERWEFPSITYHKTSLKLAKPISATVSFDDEDETIWISNEQLNVFGVGKDWDEALEDFSQSFVTKFSGYVAMPDKALTQDAMELRDQMRRLVPKWREVSKDVVELQDE